MLEPIDGTAPPELSDDEAEARDAPKGRELARELEELHDRLRAAQGRLAADRRRALLVVLQGRDTAGKDGTIRNVFSACNPQGCRVTSFAAPSGAELARDYLWRVHRAVPPRGMIGIFNRSHYEVVLAARVRGIVPEAVWSRRFRHITEFERLLSDEGTVVLKLFLHVSRAEQARRLRKRLVRPDKNWKFDAKDLDDRLRWNAYTLAYRDAFRATSTEWAPWHVVPADDKQVRNYFVAGTLVRALESLDLHPPELPAEKQESLRTMLDAQLAAEDAES